MTDLEKRAEEMFNKMITFYSRDCGRNRDYAREIAIKSVVEFAQKETKLLSKHIVELQVDKGRLTDEINEWKTKFENLERKCRFNFTDLLEDVEKEIKQDKQLAEAKELLRKFMPYVIESYLKQDISNIKLSFDEIEKAEAFLKENKE